MGLTIFLVTSAYPQLLKLPVDTVKLTAPVGAVASYNLSLENTGDTIALVDFNILPIDTVSFIKADGADWTLPANQDSISPDLIITRANDESIFNIATETGFDWFISPAGTKWAQGITGTSDPEDYESFYETLNENVGNNVISYSPLSMQYTLENRYFDFYFTSWSCCGAGGFAYTRYEIPAWLKITGGSYIYPHSSKSFAIECRPGMPAGNYVGSVLFYKNGNVVDTLIVTLELTNDAKDVTFAAETLEIDYIIGSESFEVPINNSSSYNLPVYFEAIVPGSTSVSFTKDPYADWTLPANQDSLSPDVIITRQDSEGLFNIARETNYGSDESPLGTLWSISPTIMADKNDYGYFREIMEYSVGANIFDNKYSLMLPDEDRAFNLEFTSWSSGGTGGGFAYTRKEVTNWLKVFNPEQLNLVIGVNSVDFKALIGLGNNETDLVMYDIMGNALDTLHITLNGVLPNISFPEETVNYDYVIGSEPFVQVNLLNSEVSSIFGSIKTILPGAEPIVFTKADFADWTLPANQDSINADVSITRRNSQSIFNIETEVAYVAGVSPAGTEWYFNSTLVSPKNNYSVFVDAIGGSVGENIFHNTLSMHLLNEDRYFDVDFMEWTQGNNGGGFAYSRIEVPGWLYLDGDEGEIPANSNFPIPFELECEPGEYHALVILYAASGDALDTLELNVTARLPEVEFISDTITIDYLLGTTPVINVPVVNNESVLLEGEFNSMLADAVEVEFTKVNNADWTLPVNQDSIAANVKLTRANNEGLFNIALEAGYSYDISPIGTLWAMGVPLGTDNNQYADFREALNYNVGDYILNGPLALYLEEEDRYFRVDFSQWSANNTGGGFSYTRTEVPGWLRMDEATTGINSGTNNISANLLLSETGNYQAKLIVSFGIYPIDTVVVNINVSLPDIQFALDTIEIEHIHGSSNALSVQVINNEDIELSTEIKAIIPGTQSVSFEKINYADYTLPVNRDSISPNVALTRRTSQGLYNITQEAVFTSNVSPIGTIWTRNFTMETQLENYLNFQNAFNGSGDLRYTILSSDVSLYLEEEKRYFDVDFTKWTCCGNGGGFAYTRTEVPGWLKGSIDHTFDAGATQNVDYNMTFNAADTFYAQLIIYVNGTMPIDTLYIQANNILPDIKFTGDTLDVDFLLGNGQAIIPVQNNEAISLTGSIVKFDPSALTVNFSKANYANYSDPANQDAISPQVVITRQNNRGIYNIRTESGYNNNSPGGTLWALKTQENPIEESYNTWRNTFYSGGVNLRNNIVNNPSWMYLPNENRYFEVVFTSWTGGNAGGGFAYNRKEYPNWFEGEYTDHTFNAGSLNNLNFVANADTGLRVISLILFIEGLPIDTVLVNLNGKLPDINFTQDVLNVNYSIGTELLVPVINNEGVNIETSVKAFVPEPLPVVFIKPDYADYTDEIYQDSIAPDILITRQNNEGLYNIAQEGNPNRYISPIGTLWSMGNTMSTETGDYMNFAAALNYQVGNNILQGPMSMMVPESKKYFDVEFSNWTDGNNGGGVSYRRVEVPGWLKNNDMNQSFAANATNPFRLYVLNGFENYESMVILMVQGYPVDTVMLTIAAQLPDVEFAQDLVQGNFIVGGEDQTLNVTITNSESLPVDLKLKLVVANAVKVNFEKDNYADWTLTNNQDSLSNNVILTRQNSRGLFNIKDEDYYRRYLSPMGTKWAAMPTMLASREDYNDFTIALDDEVGENIFNSTMSLMLENDKRCFDVDFTAWTQDNDGGGFAYTRIETPWWLKANDDDLSLATGANTINLDIELVGIPAGTYQAKALLYAGDVALDSTQIQIQAANPVISMPDTILINIAEGSVIAEILQINNSSGIGIECENAYAIVSGTNKVHFYKQDDTDWTLPQNQDSISPNVILTRAYDEALFNIVTESGYINNYSPDGTLWSFNRTLNSDDTDYDDFRGALFGEVGISLNYYHPTMSMLLTEEGRYFDVSFKYWANGDYDGEGGFMYDRIEVPYWMKIPGFSNNLGESYTTYPILIDGTNLSSGTYSADIKFEISPNLVKTVKVITSIGGPIVVSPMADRYLDAGFEAFQVDLSDVFASTGGRTLTYSASSSNSTVATVNVTGNTLTVTEISDGNAEITVKATDTEDAFVTDDFNLVIVPGTNVNETFTQNTKIYPNPTTGMLYIEVLQKGKVIVEITDLTSRTIHYSESFDSTIEIDLGGFTKGIYLLRLINEKGAEITEKLIIQ